ncbi:ATP-binding protein [Actinopolymorpha alba]|uniref:ATP-binding protein n=1 Tax=Actinopolymorpha alba TaxID=533267 RepID=UPI0003A56D7D|nr:BTAD domain-containing putative transcriptional regulator [Actinopolymorpha alba]
MGEPVVRVGVLGAVIIKRPANDGTVLSLPAGQRGLLAALVLGEPPLTAGGLIDLLWDERAPTSGRTWTHVTVNRLRTWLRKHVGDGIRVEHSSGGYELAISGGLTDADRFTTLYDNAATMRQPHQRGALLIEALTLWRGPIAADAPDAIRRCERAQHLQRQRILAAELLADTALESGDAVGALPHLSVLVEEHPFHERLHARYALLLASQGEQAAAFDVINQLSRRLSDELGVVPSEDVRNAHEQLLRQSVGEQRTSRRTSCTATWRGPRCHLDRLIGRDLERTTLLEMLGRHRLVTISGTGGCGKTTLALRVAEDIAPRFPDGVVVLTMATLSSFDGMLAALGALAKVRSNDGDPLDTIENTLSSRQIMLVIDNCEHLAEESATLVRRLLGACPNLTILTTSRQPLGVPEERLWPLEPLAVPAPEEAPDPRIPAIELFLIRAQETAPAQQLSEGENLSHVAAICRLLDGLPLAVELAAAQLRLLDVGELHSRLRHGMELLGRATSGGDPRHRTLEATIDWSYRLLTSDERVLLSRLSGLAGTFRLADAEYVCGFPPLGHSQIAPTLARLVDRSLVQPVGQGASRRFRLLRAVSAFAAERLNERTEGPQVADRLLALWLDRAREFDTLPHYRARVTAALELESEASSLRSALEHAYAGGRDLDAAELTARVFEFWMSNRSYLPEGEGWLERALASVGTQKTERAPKPEVSVLLRFHQAMVRALRGDYLSNLALMTDLVDELAGHRPREHLEAQANLLTIRCSLLDPAALPHAARAIEFVRTSQDAGALTVLTAAGSVLTTWGRYDQAADLAESYARIQGRAGHSRSLAQQALRLEITLGRGDFDAAQALADDITNRLHELTNPAEHDPPRRALALNYLVNGNHVAAQRFLSDAVDWIGAAYPKLNARLTGLCVLLAEAHRRAGDLDLALRALSDGLAASAGNSNYRHALPGVLQAALIAADLGDIETGTALAREWDTLRRRLGLAIPLGLEHAIAVLGIDPRGSQPEPQFSWSEDLFEELLSRAHTWCTTAIER